MSILQAGDFLEGAGYRVDDEAAHGDVAGHQLTEHLKERDPFYSKARYTLDVNVLDDYDKIKTSVESLRALLNL